MNNLKPEQVKISDIGQRTEEKRKLAILDCIRQYPGHTENWYADVMTLNHICARKTTLQIIRELASDGQINDDKVGNSFHRYSINVQDKYIGFTEVLKEFGLIEEEFLSFYDKVWDFFYNDHDLKQLEGTSFWKEYESELDARLTALKVLAVDAVGLLLSIQHEMMHKYDHIGYVSIFLEILRLVDLVTAGEKGSCFKWFNRDLNNLVTQTERDSVGELLRENGLTCERLITRLTKFERDLKDKFMDESSLESHVDSIDVLRSGQTSVDDYVKDTENE